MHQGQDTFQILHTDPDGAITTATADGLQAEDPRLVTTAVHTTAEAVQLLAAGAFDCLLSEYELPEQSGADLLADIRNRECRLPVIFYTSADVSAVAAEALAAGAADCIQKDAGDAHYALLANRIRNAVAATTTERTQQRRSEALDVADSGIAVVDSDGRYSFVNEAYADRYGYDADDIIGRRWELTVPASEGEVIRTEVLPAIREGDTWKGTTSGLRADGSTFRAEATFAQTSAGGFVCIVPSEAEESERPATVKQLHSTACELMEATTAEAVAESAVSAATDILTAPACAVYRYDEATDALVVAAQSRPGGETGISQAESPHSDSIAWRAYESGEPQVHADRAESTQRLIRRPMAGHGLRFRSLTGVFSRLPRGRQTRLPTRISQSHRCSQAGSR